MRIKHILRIKHTLCFIMLAAVAACQSQPKMPTSGPAQVKIGKPYVIEGKTYYPAYDPTYDKIGDGSWYGPGFHGKYTANGEVFNQNDLTAAHPTLPMPSLVRVTNLANGRSVIVRINDRGPFKKNRIIDLSKKSAERIGMKHTMPVRVQYLKEETETYLASLQEAGSKPIDMVAYNEKAENAKSDSIERAANDKSQPVEETNEVQQPGQIVTNAAPILTVSSGDLDGNQQQQESRYRAPRLIASAQANEIGASEIEAADIQQNDVPATNAANSNEVEIDTSSPSARNEQELSIQELPPEATTVKQPPIKPTPHHAADTSQPRFSETAPPDSGTSAKTTNQSANKLVPQTGYYIQVGSFGAKENADKIANRVKGTNVNTAKINIGDKSWWRVRVGPFTSRADAEAALPDIQAAGAPDARVIHP